MAEYKVVNATQLDTDLTTVADAIREKTGSTQALSWPEDYSAGIGRVYDKGCEDAAQSEYDQFWDMHQDYGNRYEYKYAFAGEGWSRMALEGKFVPKYPIKPKSMYKLHGPANGMFLYFNRNNSTPFDLSNVQMDFSECTEAASTFENCYIENIICDFGNCWLMDKTFNASDTDRKGVNKLKLRVTEALTSVTIPFGYAHQLADLEFFGDSMIAVSGFDFGQSCKLSKQSIQNVFSVLSDSTTGLSISFNLTAVNNAFETSEGATDGSSSAEWAALVATKPNWTVSLEDFIPAGGIA